MASKSYVRRLEYTLGAIALFSAFVVYNSDPSGFGPFAVGAVSYFSGIALLFSSALGFSGRRRPTYLLMVVGGTAAILVSVYAMTGGNGLPAQGDQLGLSCSTTTTTIQNASGLSSETSCTNSIPYFDYWSVLVNVAFWSPLIGSVVYAMPSLIEPGRRNLATSGSRVVVGSVIAGTLLFLTFGLDDASSGFPELFNGHSPLNPFVAYNNCDSITFGIVTCVQVNALYYSIDYVFWVAVVALFAMVLSEITDAARKRLRHDRGVVLTLEKGTAGPDEGLAPVGDDAGGAGV
jgi:hypothetical protein